MVDLRIFFQNAFHAWLMLLLATIASHAADTPRPLMLVVNKTSHRVTLLDRLTGEEICHAPVGVNPHEAAFSLDGSHFYVPVYGTGGVGQPGTDEHALHIFNTSDCRQTALMDTGNFRRLHGIKVGKSGLLYVTAENARSVIVIDPEKQKIIASIPTGSPYSHMLVVMPDERKAYTSNVMSRSISVLDLRGHKLLKQIATEVPNQRMALSPDARWFVTTLGEKHSVAFYRTSDDKLDFEVPLEGSPYVTCFSPDGKYLYVAGYDAAMKAAAWKIDLADKKVVSTLHGVGQHAGTIAVDPQGEYAYASDEKSDTISKIRTSDWTLNKRIQIESPDQIVFAH